MCMIIDTNSLHKFLAAKGNAHYADAKPVHQWLAKSGKIAYSQKTLEEAPGHAKKKLANYKQEGKVRFVSQGEIDNHVRQDQEYAKQCEDNLSNDRHILDLAAAITAGRGNKCVTLWTEDSNLAADCKKMGLGKIYKNKSHERLLKQTRCPPPPAG